MQLTPTKQRARAAIIGLLAVCVIAVPTDIIDTPWFSREVPVRWWEYPVLLATGLLTTAWFGIESSRSHTGAVTSGWVLTTFAVGCPVCNKIVLAAIGTSGAMGIWAPLQPALAAVSVTLLAVLVVIRWRGRTCESGRCGTTPGAAASDVPGSLKVSSQ